MDTTILYLISAFLWIIPAAFGLICLIYGSKYSYRIMGLFVSVVPTAINYLTYNNLDITTHCIISAVFAISVFVLCGYRWCTISSEEAQRYLGPMKAMPNPIAIIIASLIEAMLAIKSYFANKKSSETSENNTKFKLKGDSNHNNSD